MVLSPTRLACLLPTTLHFSVVITMLTRSSVLDIPSHDLLKVDIESAPAEDFSQAACTTRRWHRRLAQDDRGLHSYFFVCKEAVAVLLALLVTIIDLDDIDMALPRRLAGKTRLVRPRRQLRSKHAPGGQTLKWRLLKTTPVLSVHAMANIDLPGTLTVRTDSFLGL